MADPADAEADDGLARLRERLAATQLAAERLVADIERGAAKRTAAAAPRGDVRVEAQPSQATAGASGQGSRQGRPPPAGYQIPDSAPADSTLDELAALARMFRALVPDELAHELVELAREALLLLRVLIDWLIGRLERQPAQSVEVTDIPIG